MQSTVVIVNSKAKLTRQSVASGIRMGIDATPESAMGASDRGALNSVGVQRRTWDSEGPLLSNAVAEGKTMRHLLPSGSRVQLEH